MHMSDFLACLHVFIFDWLLKQIQQVVQGIHSFANSITDVIFYPHLCCLCHHLLFFSLSPFITFHLSLFLSWQCHLFQSRSYYHLHIVLLAPLFLCLCSLSCCFLPCLSLFVLPHPSRFRLSQQRPESKRG